MQWVMPGLLITENYASNCFVLHPPMHSAWLYTAALTTGKLAEMGNTPLEHRPFCLDMFPCNFCMFSLLNKGFRRKTWKDITVEQYV